MTCGGQYTKIKEPEDYQKKKKKKKTTEQEQKMAKIPNLKDFFIPKDRKNAPREPFKALKSDINPSNAAPLLAPAFAPASASVPVPVPAPATMATRDQAAAEIVDLTLSDDEHEPKTTSPDARRFTTSSTPDWIEILE